MRLLLQLDSLIDHLCKHGGILMAQCPSILYYHSCLVYHKMLKKCASFSSLLTARSDHDQCRQSAIWSNPSSTHLPASFRNTSPDFLLSTAEKESVGGRICIIFYLGTHSIYLELCQSRSVLTLLVNAFWCRHQIWRESVFSHPESNAKMKIHVLRLIGPLTHLLTQYWLMKTHRWRKDNRLSRAIVGNMAF